MSKALVNPVMVFKKGSYRTYNVLDHQSILRGTVTKFMTRHPSSGKLVASWTAWRQSGVPAHAGAYHKRKDAAAYLFT